MRRLLRGAAATFGLGAAACSSSASAFAPPPSLPLQGVAVSRAIPRPHSCPHPRRGRAFVLWSSDSNSDSNSDKSDSENTDPDAVPEPDPDADSANEISSKASSEASNPPSSSRHPRGTTDLSAMSGLDLNLSKMEFSKAVKVAKAKAEQVPNAA